MQKAVLARMTRTLSSLFTSSVPILEAMTIVEKVVENEVIARVIRQCHDELGKRTVDDWTDEKTLGISRHWLHK